MPDCMADACCCYSALFRYRVWFVVFVISSNCLILSGLSRMNVDFMFINHTLWFIEFKKRFFRNVSRLLENCHTI